MTSNEIVQWTPADHAKALAYADPRLAKVLSDYFASFAAGGQANSQTEMAISDYLDSMRVRGLRPDTIRTRRSALASITRDLARMRRRAV